jgi:hypothetical protein
VAKGPNGLTAKPSDAEVMKTRRKVEKLTQGVLVRFEANGVNAWFLAETRVKAEGLS